LGREAYLVGTCQSASSRDVAGAVEEASRLSCWFFVVSFLKKKSRSGESIDDNGLLR